MNDFLYFKKMITPTIIQIVFWIAAGLAALSGLVTVITGLFSSYGRSGMTVLIGLGWMVLGPLLARIYCELIIVVFNINDTLKDIRSGLEKKS